ncbi:MAG: hypothetical protein PHH00_02835 [Candidatus Nanoarchaeia archaeon]|nr:hypothetical protein [Candidatus Nanoarchaeia archaeon]
MKKNIFGVILVVATFLALGYILLSPSGIGVLVSCNDYKIVEVRNMPPPLMSIYQPEFCRVNVTVSYLNNTPLCQGYGGIFNSEQGIIECDNLKNFKGLEVNVNARFFDLNNNFIKEDNKQLKINP